MVAGAPDSPVNDPSVPTVFISYSSKDLATAGQVCAHLEAAGFSCWIAPRNIPTGVEYADGIVSGIEGARLMVLVFSPAANTSPAVRREVEIATNRGIPVLPLMIERTMPTGGMEYYLRSRQWRNAFAGPLADSLRVLEAEVTAHLSGGPRPYYDPLRRLWRRLVNVMGGATFIFLILIAAAATLLWIVRVTLTPAERRLGVAALVVALVSWPVVRWQGVFNTRRRLLAAKLAVLVLLVGGWTTAAVMAHRTPIFSRSGPGILIARIVADGDRQAWLAAKLRAYIEAGSGLDDDAIEVKALPRRVSSTQEAQGYARASGAMVVLWGSMAEGFLQLKVTMADGEGIYDASAPIIADKDLELSDAAADFQDVLVAFLGAHRLYQKKDLAAALERFDRIAAALTGPAKAGRPGLVTPVEATLSTVIFYQATTRYQLALKTGDFSVRSRVIEEYEQSARYATKAGNVSGFATPVANLAGILLSSGTAEDLKQAAGLLEKTACETHSAFAPIPCLYIEYERAVLDNHLDRYAEGRAKLDRLLTVKWPAAALPEDSPHRLLLAYAYRNRAYSHARLGDAHPAANGEDYQRADRDWAEAEKTFRALEMPVPSQAYLTRARIQVGLRHVDEARAALDTAVAGGSKDSDIPLLRATIAECAGDSDARNDALAEYLMKAKIQKPGEFEKLKREADRQLSALAGHCRTPKEGSR